MAAEHITWSANDAAAPFINPAVDAGFRGTPAPQAPALAKTPSAKHTPAGKAVGSPRGSVQGSAVWRYRCQAAPYQFRMNVGASRVHVTKSRVAQPRHPSEGAMVVSSQARSVSPEAVSYVDATFRRPRAVTAALPDGIAWSFVAVLLVVSLGLTAAAAAQRVQPATPYWRSDPAHDLFVGSWALLVFAAAAQLAFAVWRQWRWRESGAPSNPLYALLVVAAVLLGAAVAVTAFAWPYSAAANNQCIAPSVDSFLSGNVFVGGSNNGNGSSIGGIVDVGAAVGGSGCACAQFGWEVFTCGVSSPTDDTCADVCDGGADCWEGVCDPDFLAGYRTVASLAAVWLALVLALGTAAAGGPLSGFLYPDSLDDELAMECELVLRGARRDGLPLRFTVAASDGEAVMAEVCAVAQAAKARKSRRASA